MDGNDRVILKGADVVAYFTQNAHKQGNPAIKSTYENVTFYFSSAENKALFDKEPTRYLPEFGGYCANGIVYAIPWAVTPTPGACSTASSTSSAALARETPSCSTCRATASWLTNTGTKR